MFVVVDGMACAAGDVNVEEGVGAEKSNRSADKEADGVD